MVDDTQSAESTGPAASEQETQAPAVAEQQPAGPTPEEIKAFKAEAEAKIDAFMKLVGYNPPDRTDETGWRYFTLGSADGRAAIVQMESDLYLRVEALVMAMPSDKELILPLMRELLNFNIDLSGPTRLGIDGDNIYTALLYPVKALADDEYGNMIHWTMSLADRLDDDLIKKYGGTSKTRGGDQQAPPQPPAPAPEGEHA
jgi:hypothetical protein